MKKEINRKEVQEWVKERFELSVERIREIARGNIRQKHLRLMFISIVWPILFYTWKRFMRCVRMVALYS